MSDYDLVAPFLTDDPAFGQGVEFGMLYRSLANPKRQRLRGYYHTGNQDRILVAASRLGWRVIKAGPDESGWFWLRLERRGWQQGQPLTDEA